ncbi:MAG: nitrous oxide reductase family maturation protein NosD [Deltaproteobacteria bacterium]|nr:nitrous oxide reductase family maturation protein NosD [Deltaproteobacteria bacterium]
MRSLQHGALLERRIAFPALAITTFGLLLAALIRRRWSALFAVPAVAAPVLFAADLYWWMREYGLHLDPKAPLNHAVKPFVPPILGDGQIAQFHVTATFAEGFGLAVLAAVLVAVGIAFKLRGQTPKRLGVAAAISACLLGFSSSGEAATLAVGAGQPYATLSEALAHAEDGDTLLVDGGVHVGHLTIDKSVVLIGAHAPVLDGGGTGTVVRITAPKVTLKGFTIRGSGDLLASGDAGVLVAAPEVVIEGNRFEDVLFGVSFRRAPQSVLRRNVLRGKSLPVPRRGDLIHVWYSDAVLVEDNLLADGRDAVLWFSKRLTIQRNTIQRARYGLHFMYCDDSVVQDNRLLESSVGIYLMYSTRLRLLRNQMLRGHGPSGYGLGLKDMDAAVIEDNVIADNRVGIFLEHSTGRFSRNLISYNDTGIRLMPSATGNTFAANSFVENGEQVTIDGMSEQTRNLWEGNYWSDYRGFDANGDGIGDVPYRSMRLFEQLTDRYPAFRLYAGSPVAQAIDFAASLFPLFAPQPRFEDAHPRLAALRPLAPSGVWGGP